MRPQAARPGFESRGAPKGQSHRSLRFRCAPSETIVMNRAVGVIPARWSSTRFPGKPLHLIAGKPLLRRVWEQSRRAKNLDLVIIATDDMRIAENAFNWGAEVALTSPSHRSGTDRVAEVARHAKDFAFVVNIQGDEPLIDPRLIDQLVKKLRSHSNIDIVTAAHPIRRSSRSKIAPPDQSCPGSK